MPPKEQAPWPQVLLPGAQPKYRSRPKGRSRSRSRQRELRELDIKVKRLINAINSPESSHQ